MIEQARKKQAPLTQGEWTIIEVVWEREPCAAPTVQEALAERKKWPYGTVKTLMDRMAGKGLLTTERIRNLILYRSTITREQAQRREIMGTIKRAFNGAMTPMMQFLLDKGDLSERDLGELETAIRARRQRSAGRDEGDGEGEKSDKS